MLRTPSLDKVAIRDQTAVLGWEQRGQSTRLVVGLSDYADGLTNSLSVLILDPHSAGAQEGVSDDASTPGPMALADVDGDDDLDLFVGGRVLRGRYPAPATSRLYRNEEVRLTLDHVTRRVLQRVGLVRGAAAGDLNDDGFPELILACE
jgi:hypothetical protein